MKAMILAAGRGSRMGSLTKKIPKPLTKINNHTLIEYNLFKLKEANIDEVIINVSWLGNKIIEKLGSGSIYDIKIEYSFEKEKLLGTAGGIRNVLDFFNNENFWLINADIFSNYKLKNLQLQTNKLGHLILVKNPINGQFHDFFGGNFTTLFNFCYDDSC